MKHTSKKPILFCALLLCLTLLFGCSNTPSGTESSASSGAASSGVSSDFPLTSDGIFEDTPTELDSTVIMKLFGEDISLAEYRYYLFALKADHDNGDESYWEDPAHEALLKERALECVKSTHAMKQFAAQKGVSLTPEELEEHDYSIISVKSYYQDAEEYAKDLAVNHLTPMLYDKMTETYSLQEKLLASLYGEGGEYEVPKEKQTELVEKEFVCMSHIMITFDKDGSTAQKEKAEEALAKLQSGADFEEVLKEYGEDTGVESNPDGYYFTHHEMEEPIEEATYALGIGEISGLVESSGGYHIIKRLPLDPDYVKENLNTLISNYYYSHFDFLLRGLTESAQPEFLPAYDSISLSDLA